MLVRSRVRKLHVRHDARADTLYSSLLSFVAIATITIAAVIFGFTAECHAGTNSKEGDHAATKAAEVHDEAGATTSAHAVLTTRAMADTGSDDGATPSLTADPILNAPGETLPVNPMVHEPAPRRKCILFIASLCGAVNNKSILSAATIQSAALIADGVTTRQYLQRGYVEVDPFARFFLGRRPTWARMAPLGSIQVIGGMWLAERMATSRNHWIRRFWWLPQIAGIAGNAAATANNVALR